MSILKKNGVEISKKTAPNSVVGINNIQGMYIGEVIDNVDSLYSGRITVRINDFQSQQAEHICLLALPFGGHTEIKDSGDDKTKEAQAPMSYGMWPQPPEIGTNVVVMFTGSLEQGIVMGSLVSKDNNSMMGGRASGPAYVDGKVELGPVVEKNTYDTDDDDTKPLDEHFQAVLNQQGLSLDYVRGHSKSGARRESPSKVFGITTRQGHVLTMDDGDESGASNNIRLRTKSGAQILMDDSNGFIFVTTQTGDAWIEMNNVGQVDVYSKAGINMHTEGDYNVHAKGSINMQAEVGVNIKSTGGDGIKLETTVAGIDVYSALDIKIQSPTNYHLKVDGNVVMKGGKIDMNGPEPDEATKITIQNQESNDNVITSIASRVPEHHPWKGVDGLDPVYNTQKGRIL